MVTRPLGNTSTSTCTLSGMVLTSVLPGWHLGARRRPSSAPPVNHAPGAAAVILDRDPGDITTIESPRVSGRNAASVAAEERDAPTLADKTAASCRGSPRRNSCFVGLGLTRAQRSAACVRASPRSTDNHDPPVARNVSQHIAGGSPAAAARLLDHGWHHPSRQRSPASLSPARYHALNPGPGPPGGDSAARKGSLGVSRLDGKKTAWSRPWRARRECRPSHPPSNSPPNRHQQTIKNHARPRPRAHPDRPDPPTRTSGQPAAIGSMWPYIRPPNTPRSMLCSHEPP